MADISHDYPAHTDGNGVTWYRPVRQKGQDVSQWGWTNDPKQAHPDYRAGDLTKIQKVENQMDKRRKIMEDMVIENGMDVCEKSQAYTINKGRWQAFGQALAIMRGTKFDLEIERSNQRIGVEE